MRRRVPGSGFWVLGLLLLTGCRPRTTSMAAEQTVILVSIDGFHPAYLDLGVTPRLAALAARGVRAQWMTPVFPANTFPNHYTLVTGLLPTHHGIVDNHFVDPVDGMRFRYSAGEDSRRARWYVGEALWTAAERHGVRTASFFWPGSDHDDPARRPTTWKAYEDSFPMAPRVDSVLAWLALPAAERPRFVTMYFSHVDRAGHDQGPASPGLAAAVALADSLVGRLLDGLGRQGIDANVLVVSDHGMAALSRERLVVIDDYLDRARVNAISLGSTIQLRPAATNGLPADSIAAALARAPHLFVYPRAETPARWRYRDNPRVSDVVGVAEAGWVLTTRANVAANRGPSAGAHGFDNTDSTMRALFVAAGPAFRRSVVVPPFSNIHVYELMCRVLGIAPGANDGSLDSVRMLLR